MVSPYVACLCRIKHYHWRTRQTVWAPWPVCVRSCWRLRKWPLSDPNYLNTNTLLKPNVNQSTVLLFEVSRKKSKKICYNMNWIVNRQQIESEWGTVTHFQFQFATPHSINISYCSVIWSVLHQTFSSLSSTTETVCDCREYSSHRSAVGSRKLGICSMVKSVFMCVLYVIAESTAAASTARTRCSSAWGSWWASSSFTTTCTPTAPLTSPPRSTWVGFYWPHQEFDYMCHGWSKKVSSVTFHVIPM